MDIAISSACGCFNKKEKNSYIFFFKFGNLHSQLYNFFGNICNKWGHNRNFKYATPNQKVLPLLIGIDK